MIAIPKMDVSDGICTGANRFAVPQTIRTVGVGGRLLICKNADQLVKSIIVF